MRMNYPDRSIAKEDKEDIIPLYQKVYFPAYGKPHIRKRDTIFLKSYPQLEMDIKRLATRFHSIDEQWIIRNVIHIMATVPLTEFNQVFKSYMGIKKRKAIEERNERRNKYPLGATGRILNAGGIDWLIWSKANGRSMKKTAERIDVPPSAIQYFLRTRYNKKWSEI